LRGFHDFFAKADGNTLGQGKAHWPLQGAQFNQEKVRPISGVCHAKICDRTKYTVLGFVLGWWCAHWCPYATSNLRPPLTFGWMLGQYPQPPTVKP
jgi:hypothetical protein